MDEITVKIGLRSPTGQRVCQETIASFIFIIIKVERVGTKSLARCLVYC